MSALGREVAAYGWFVTSCPRSGFARQVMALFWPPSGRRRRIAFCPVPTQAQRRPDATDRVRHHLVGEAGRAGAVPAGLRPRLGVDRHHVGHRGEDPRRADLAGAEQCHRRARPQRRVGDGEGQAARHEGRQRVDRRDHRRHARCAVVAHLAAWLPGPRRHGVVQEGDQGGGPPGLHRGAGGEPPPRRAPRRRPRPVRADHHRRSRQGLDRRRLGQAPGYSVRHRRRGTAHGERQQAGARSVQLEQHVAGVERPGRRDRQGQP